MNNTYIVNLSTQVACAEKAEEGTVVLCENGSMFCWKDKDAGLHETNLLRLPPYVEEELNTNKYVQFNLRCVLHIIKQLDWNAFV